MTTYNPTPITGYSEGSITSDDKPVRCVETFDDNRHDNVNLYFEIDGKFYNVHPCAADGRYPVRWIDSSAPVGWPDDYELRVRKLEAEGCTRSDAQAVVDAEDLRLTRYEILVSGHPFSPAQLVTAESPDAAVDKYLVRTYGSALSSRAPYNLSATRLVK